MSGHDRRTTRIADRVRPGDPAGQRPTVRTGAVLPRGWTSRPSATGRDSGTGGHGGTGRHGGTTQQAESHRPRTAEEAPATQRQVGVAVTIEAVVTGLRHRSSMAPAVPAHQSPQVIATGLSRARVGPSGRPVGVGRTSPRERRRCWRPVNRFRPVPATVAMPRSPRRCRRHPDRPEVLRPSGWESVSTDPSPAAPSLSSRPGCRLRAAICLLVSPVAASAVTSISCSVNVVVASRAARRPAARRPGDRRRGPHPGQCGQRCPADRAEDALEYPPACRIDQLQVVQNDDQPPAPTGGNPVSRWRGGKNTWCRPANRMPVSDSTPAAVSTR